MKQFIRLMIRKFAHFQELAEPYRVPLGCFCFLSVFISAWSPTLSMILFFVCFVIIGVIYIPKVFSVYVLLCCSLGLFGRTKDILSDEILFFLVYVIFTLALYLGYLMYGDTAKRIFFSLKSFVLKNRNR